jgi:predicted nucleic-acid-binding protein
LVRLLTGDPKDLALSAMRYLRERERSGDRVLVSDWVVAEAYYALQHHYGVSKGDTLTTLREFLSSPGIECTGEATEVLSISNLHSAKPGFIDRVIHRNYLRSGAEQMITFEKASAKLASVHVLVP